MAHTIDIQARAEKAAKAAGKMAGKGRERLEDSARKFSSGISSEYFLIGCFASMLISALLQLGGKRHTSLFIGQWVPSLILLGLYNKMVKKVGAG